MPPQAQAHKAAPRAAWLGPQVLVFGLASLLTDMSSEMVMPFLPVFITTVLGGGALALGAVDGVAEAIAAVLKLQAGRWSDRLGRRRPFVVAGYGLSALSRPLMGLAGSPWTAGLVRAADRVGKGLRTSSRDALLASSVGPQQQGRAFGFHRAMDHLGAVLGPLLALGILGLIGREPEKLRQVFLWGAVPGLLAVLLLWLFVREAETGAAPRLRRSRHWLPPRPLRPFLLALTLFTFGASSDLFLLLRVAPPAPDDALMALPWLWIGLHIVKSSSSLLGGDVGDRLGPKRTLALGWGLYAAVYAGFAFSRPGPLGVALLLVYGLYYGLTESPEKMFVAGLSSPAGRAEGFGWYHMVTGLGMLPASLLFGWLYDAAGPKAAFLTGSAFAFGGLVLLWRVPAPPRAPKRRRP